MATFATLNLTRVWITNFAVDMGGGVPGSVHAGSMNDGGSPGKVFQVSQAGEFRSYAGGRTRLVLGTSISYSEPLMLRAVPESDVKLLINWTGDFLLFRDTYGMKMWGSYLAPSVSWTPLSTPRFADVVILFTAVTYSEGV